MSIILRKQNTPSQYHDKLYPRCEQAIHSCSAQVVLTEDSVEIRGDVKDEMKRLVEAKALVGMTSSAYQIANAILGEIQEKYKSNDSNLLNKSVTCIAAVGYAGLTRNQNQLRDYVYQVRRQIFQEWENAIRSPSLSTVSTGDQRLFYVLWQMSILKRLGSFQELLVRNES